MVVHIRDVQDLCAMREVDPGDRGETIRTRCDDRSARRACQIPHAVELIDRPVTAAVRDVDAGLAEERLVRLQQGEPVGVGLQPH